MKEKTYYKSVSVIFAILAIAHAMRLAYAWPANIGGVDIPLWASGAAVLIAGYLAVRGWQFAGKKHKR